MDGPASGNGARRYSVSRYKRIIERIPPADARIRGEFSADAIVGFPGESEAQFRATMEPVGGDSGSTCSKQPAGLLAAPQHPSATWPGQVSEAARVDGFQSSMPWWRVKARRRSGRYLGPPPRRLVEEQPPRSLPADGPDPHQTGSPSSRPTQTAGGKIYPSRSVMVRSSRCGLFSAQRPGRCVSPCPWAEPQIADTFGADPALPLRYWPRSPRALLGVRGLR